MMQFLWAGPQSLILWAPRIRPVNFKSIIECMAALAKNVFGADAAGSSSASSSQAEERIFVPDVSGSLDPHK